MRRRRVYKRRGSFGGRRGRRRGKPTYIKVGRGGIRL